VIIAMGATASRGLLGRAVTIAKLRGAPIATPDDSRVIVTAHPSYLLRGRYETDKERQYAAFVADLRPLATAQLAEPWQRRHSTADVSSATSTAPG
jgi:uracil-DNA glycosylase